MRYSAVAIVAGASLAAAQAPAWGQCECLDAAFEGLFYGPGAYNSFEL